MITNVKTAAEPPDSGLKSTRNAAVPAPDQSGGTASDTVNNVSMERLFARGKDLAGSPFGQFPEVASEESANQYTQYARTSILERPAIAMAAQANQLPQSVLQLLN